MVQRAPGKADTMTCPDRTAPHPRIGRPRGTPLSGSVLALVAGAIAACGTETAGPPPPPETLRLPVRVHVLSSRLAPFDAKLDDSHVAGLFERVNRIWSQADIAWEVESVLREPIVNEDAIEEILNGPFVISLNQLVSLLPKERLTDGRWDVFLAHDLGEAGAAPGVFLWTVPAVLSSEVGPSAVEDAGRVLAHELGHTLTLPHVPCTAGGNLMAPRCESFEPTALTREQIDRARRQAETGSPATTF